MDLLIQEIHGMIQTLDDAVLVARLIKELFDVAVKNDEHLVKLAGVIQRIIAKSSGGDEESFLLTDAEKDDLISALQEDVEDIHNQDVLNDLVIAIMLQRALSKLHHLQRILFH